MWMSKWDNESKILQSRFRGEMLNLKEISWEGGNKEHGKWSEKWKHPRLTRSKYAQVGRNKREKRKKSNRKREENTEKCHGTKYIVFTFLCITISLSVMQCLQMF